MRFITFSREGGPRVGALAEGGKGVVDLSGTGLCRDMGELIDLGPEGLHQASVALDQQAAIPLQALRVHAPIPRPRRDLICIGRNYAEHSAEFHRSGFDHSSGGAEVPDAPVVFTKATTSVIGPGEPVPASADPTATVDYEGELTVIIGPGGRDIPRERAFDHVWGYTLINDVTARELQQRHRQWFLGKSLDGFCPMGPALVTADEIDDVAALRLRTRVNGETRQDASVRDLIFDIPTLIETISSLVTLEAGDLIATGTPKGVGIGFDPPRFLRPGDHVAVEVDGIGCLDNPVS